MKEYEGNDSILFTLSDVDKNKDLTDHFELDVCPLFHFYNGKNKLDGDIEGNHMEDNRKRLGGLLPKQAEPAQIKA